MVSATQEYPRAEEALRLLAAAAGAARLYPAASALPAEAVATFATRANARRRRPGPDALHRRTPRASRSASTEIAAGNSQVAALAKSLHALQVGQLLIAPGSPSPRPPLRRGRQRRSRQRSARTAAPARCSPRRSVAHIAVVEVSLRASEEEGLLGVDLMAAPLDDIAEELEKSAERLGARRSGPGDDDVATAISRMEAATREIAVGARLGGADATRRADPHARARLLAQGRQQRPAHGRHARRHRAA